MDSLDAPLPACLVGSESSHTEPADPSPTALRHTMDARAIGIAIATRWLGRWVTTSLLSFRWTAWVKKRGVVCSPLPVLRMILSRLTPLPASLSDNGERTTKNGAFGNVITPRAYRCPRSTFSPSRLVLPPIPDIIRPSMNCCLKNLV